MCRSPGSGPRISMLGTCNSSGFCCTARSTSPLSRRSPHRPAGGGYLVLALTSSAMPEPLQQPGEIDAAGAARHRIHAGAVEDQHVRRLAILQALHQHRRGVPGDGDMAAVGFFECRHQRFQRALHRDGAEDLEIACHRRLALFNLLSTTNLRDAAGAPVARRGESCFSCAAPRRRDRCPAAARPSSSP